MKIRVILMSHSMLFFLTGNFLGLDMNDMDVGEF